MALEHGTRSSYVYGCRCPRCRRANTDYWRLFHRARGTRPRAEVDAAKAGPCGTRGAYDRGCRCDPCKAAASEHNRANHLRRKAREAAERAAEVGEQEEEAV